MNEFIILIYVYIILDMGLCAADFRAQIDQTEKGQEEQSDSSESTDSTSKVID